MRHFFRKLVCGYGCLAVLACSAITELPDGSLTLSRDEVALYRTRLDDLTKEVERLRARNAKLEAAVEEQAQRVCM